MVTAGGLEGSWHIGATRLSSRLTNFSPVNGLLSATPQVKPSHMSVCICKDIYLYFCHKGPWIFPEISDKTHFATS